MRVINCPVCAKETTNPKYCSRSCAGKYNGHHFPSRKTKKKCVNCQQTVKSYRHRRCEECHIKYKNEQYRNLTIGEYRNKKSVKDKHPSWIHAHIRNFARSWLKYMANKPCANCNYDKHVELCHIKPLSSFTDEVLLGVVNSEENVIQLCPNCHWELDNNYLDITEIRKKQAVEELNL